MEGYLVGATDDQALPTRRHGPSNYVVRPRTPCKGRVRSLSTTAIRHESVEAVAVAREEEGFQRCGAVPFYAHPKDRRASAHLINAQVCPVLSLVDPCRRIEPCSEIGSRCAHGWIDVMWGTPGNDAIRICGCQRPVTAAVIKHDIVVCPSHRSPATVNT